MDPNDAKTPDTTAQPVGDGAPEAAAKSPAEATPTDADQAPSGAETTRDQGASAQPKRRRSWKRWVANLMIVAGLLLLAYPVGTWGYTWFEQRQLREQLGRDNPGMAAALAERRSSEDFISAEPPTVTTEVNAADAAMQAITAAEEAGRLEAERQRLAKVAEFRAAATAYEERVGGKTGTPIGQIIIPSIGVDVIMLEGTGTGDLREGPGHWPETPFPGQGGNFVVSGHRTTYGAPFRKLDKLKEGDLIELVFPYGVARYAVSRVIIVYPNEVDSVAQLGREQVSLAACHPIYSAKQRIVAQGELISFSVNETGD